jgi:hypothetical protein
MFFKQLALNFVVVFTYFLMFVMDYFILKLKILADAMGLGKTVMTISLLIAHSGRGGSLGSQPITHSFVEGSEVGDTGTDSNFSNIPKKATKFTGFDKLTKKNTSLSSGGNLIICPMTLLGQWKVLTLCSYLVTAFLYLEVCITFVLKFGIYRVI